MAQPACRFSCGMPEGAEPRGRIAPVTGMCKDPSQSSSALEQASRCDVEPITLTTPAEDQVKAEVSCLAGRTLSGEQVRFLPAQRTLLKRDDLAMRRAVGRVVADLGVSPWGAQGRPVCSPM